MNEIELNLQDNVTEVGKNPKLRKSCSFVERKKREARLRRRKSSSNSTPSFLLIAGTTKTVHTVKEKFKERIFESHSVNDDKNKHGETSKEKLQLSKRSEISTQEKDTSFATHNSNEKISLPVISKDDDFAGKIETKSSIAHCYNTNLTNKNKLSKKRNWKPTSLFHTTLPPIAESQLDVANFPSAVRSTVEVTRTATPLPFL